MELRITAFKGSPWQCGNTHEAVLEVRGRHAEPDKLLGAHLVWKTETGRVIRGKVVKRHGQADGHKLVARFHRGLPGEALGTQVEVRAVQAKAEKRTVVSKARAARPEPAKIPAKTVKLAFKEEAAGNLHISNTQFDAPGKDKGKGLVEEWVEISNKGSSPADLNGWSIKDEKNHVYKFPAGTKVPAGGSLKLRTGIGKDSAGDLYWGRKAAVWNNDGDTAFLLDKTGKTVAKRSWKPE